MASLSRESGCRRIQFALGGKRRTLRLGSVPARTAETWRAHLEHLLACQTMGTAPSDETSNWLRGLNDDSYRKLARIGLVTDRRDSASPRLDRFLADYSLERRDLKATTLAAMRQSTTSLQIFFGAGKLLASFVAADADAWRASLIQGKLAKATVNKRCRYARHFFAVALRRGIVRENPFGHLKGAVAGNPARRAFVPAQTVQRVIDEMPDPQWKLLLALGRWGGLRVPSEALALTWHDVDFAGLRLVVRASKTAHHADGGIRIMPLFPELAQLFQAVFDRSQPGESWVITRYRSASCNLRTQLLRYISRAGVKPWPKLWQNLRASRATELADIYPSHVCAAWLGHTERIADTFYRQVTDEHFRRATAGRSEATQNPTQHPPESDRIGRKPKNPDCTEMAENAESYHTLPSGAASCGQAEWVLRDSNRAHDFGRSARAAPKSDAKSDAKPENADICDQLSVRQWLGSMPAELPAHLRRAITALL